MVLKTKDNQFQCQECNMLYKTKDIAQKCEDWCKKNHSCNIDIIKHAIKEKN
jgi:hypothetical protein